MSKLTNILSATQQVLSIASQAGVGKGFSEQTGLTLPDVHWPEDAKGTQEKLILGLSLIIFSLDDLGIVQLEALVKEAKQLKTAASKSFKGTTPPTPSNGQPSS